MDNLKILDTRRNGPRRFFALDHKNEVVAFAMTAKAANAIADRRIRIAAERLAKRQER